MPASAESSVERKTLYIIVAATALFLWPVTLLFRESFARGTEFQALAHLFGFGAARPASTEGWMLALVVAGAFVAVSVRTNPLIGRKLFSISKLKVVSIPFSVLAAVVEEVWFRRALMDAVQAKGYGILAQVFLSAIVFGGLHAVWGIGARSFRVAIGAVIATSLLGAALAIVYIAAGRVVAPCILAHAAINIALEPWLLVAALTRGIEERRVATPAHG